VPEAKLPEKSDKKAMNRGKTARCMVEILQNAVHFRCGMHFAATSQNWTEQVKIAKCDFARESEWEMQKMQKLKSARIQLKSCWSTEKWSEILENETFQ
jgi:hypothetical protein